VAGVGEMGTSSVGIHEDEVPLMDGEHVIDAYGEVTRWKDLDVLKTMVTFGFYYLFYLRREFVKHKAVIVTNRRVIQVRRLLSTQELFGFRRLLFSLVKAFDQISKIPGQEKG
jgi:hypothetical protein